MRIPAEILTALRFWSLDFGGTLDIEVRDGRLYAVVREALVIEKTQQVEHVRYDTILPPLNGATSPQSYLARCRDRLDKMRDRFLRERAWAQNLTPPPPWVNGHDTYLDFGEALYREYRKTD